MRLGPDWYISTVQNPRKLSALQERQMLSDADVPSQINTYMHITSYDPYDLTSTCMDASIDGCISEHSEV